MGYHPYTVEACVVRRGVISLPVKIFMLGIDKLNLIMYILNRKLNTYYKGNYK